MLFCAAACLASLPAQAQHLLQGETLDAAANVLALIVIVVVPIVGIAVFWIVHVLPEKIAHKNHHPQRDAIHMLCLLSLVFGGMLWPLAWLWAYSKPVLYKMAYGKDKHDDFYAEARSRARRDRKTCRAISRNCAATSNACSTKGAKPEELRAIRDQLAALEPRIASQAAAPAAQAALAAPVKEPH